MADHKHDWSVLPSRNEGEVFALCQKNNCFEQLNDTEVDTRVNALEGLNPAGVAKVLEAADTVDEIYSHDVYDTELHPKKEDALEEALMELCEALSRLEATDG